MTEETHPQPACADTIKQHLISFFCGIFTSCLCGCVQVIPVNANGVPIGEIPFVRSGLLGFVGPVSAAVSLQRNICGNSRRPGSHPSLSDCFWMDLYGWTTMTPLCVLPLPAGQSDLCGGEDRGSADGERAEAQRWRPGSYRSCCGASQDSVPWEVRRPLNSSSC